MKSITPNNRFIKRIFNSLLILFLVLSFFYIQTTTVKADESEKQIITMERAEGYYISPIIYPKKDIYSIILTGDAEGVMVNYNPLGGGKWEKIELSDHDEGGVLLFTKKTDNVQFRKNAFSPKPSVLKAEFIYSQDKKQETSFDEKDAVTGTQLVYAGPKIISRKEWGADESLRFWTPDQDDLASSSIDSDYSDVCAAMDKYKSEFGIDRTVSLSPSGDHLIWPLTYSKQIKKIIIHHTASEFKDLTGDNVVDTLDYMAMIRAIYHYHAVTHGWGDIGYNYIIDPLGNVYEGRFGGEKVIGAHAKCYNNGSIGISVIGNYDLSSFPDPAFNALISLIAQKAKLYNINPEATSVFRGEELPNVIGHRDSGKTSCPGKYLYSLLNDIRNRSAILLKSGFFSESGLNSQNLDYNAEATTQISTIQMLPNEKKKITLVYKNTGKQTWDSNTWLHVALNNNANGRIIPLIEDKTFVAADMKEKSVSPGGSASFELQLESGYSAGGINFEVAPVVNGKYKISKSAINVPIQIATPKFDYTIVSQNLPKGDVFQGQKLQASIKLQNTGNVRWVNYGTHPIKLGTTAPIGHKSLLIPGGSARIASLQESEVLPGNTGTFIFDMKVPDSYIGSLKETFAPTIEGIRWLEDKKTSFQINVKQPRHIAMVVSKTDIKTMMPGEMKKIEVKMQNVGDLPWDTDTMSLAIISKGLVTFKSKITPNQTIHPKQTATFSFWIQAPYSAGSYGVQLQSKFNVKPIQNGNVQFDVNVSKAVLSASVAEQKFTVFNLKPGTEKQIEVKFKNTGTVIWRSKGKNAVSLAPSNPPDRTSKLYYTEGWDSKFRAATLKEQEVKPGDVGTFRFKVKPTTIGTYNEVFQLVIEGIGWVPGSIVKWTFNIAANAVDTAKDNTSDASNNKINAAVISAARSNSSTKIVKKEKPFRLRISYADKNSIITATTKFSIYGKDNTMLLSSNANTEVTIKTIDDKISVQSGSITKSSAVIRIVPVDNGIVEIHSMERRPSWDKNLNDNKFRGVIEIRIIGTDTAYINELPLEDYLKGLAEASNTTPTEKQKVIAILARTYARFYMQSDKRKFPGMPYDGSDDPAIFQKYLGYGYEIRNPNFVKAVEQTKNQVVTYNGVMIKTPYFTQDDGRTRSAQEVWGWTDTPYLKSVDDPYCKGLKMSGHGVGLSGCGSDGMAKAGKTYSEIIKYYFQGVDIMTKDFSE